MVRAVPRHRGDLVCRDANSAHSMPSMWGSMPARHSTRCQHMRFTSSLLGASPVLPLLPMSGDDSGLAG